MLEPNTEYTQLFCYCPKCGSPIFRSGRAICTDPLQYTYDCGNHGCDWKFIGTENNLIQKIHELAKLKEEYDQTVKADAGKAKLTLVPSQIIWDIARIREYGTNKYHDPENWKKVEKERYKDAAYRHWLAYLEDEDSVDEESGLKHLWHLACNIAFLCEMENWNDKG